MTSKAALVDMLGLMLARSGKEKSKALPAHAYGDPSKHVEFGGVMEKKQIADQLLEEWHAWSAAYRPALGVPGCSPSSRQAQSSKQFQTTFEIADENLRKAEMESVEWCVDAIPLGCRQAIGIEMKNRAARSKVWRAPAGVSTYDDALEAILPIMRNRGMLD